MIHFNIKKPDNAIRAHLIEKIDNLTKPKGSLGMLEEIAIQIGWIQQSLNPSLNNPHHIVFAADHGIAAEKVSPSPQEVTYQMVANFLMGGAGINFLARQHGFAIKIVDSGVNHDFSKKTTSLIDKKIRKGTRNFLHEPAMTESEMELALLYGAEITEECFKDGCNIISFGEMGIANTSPSAIFMHYFTNTPLKECVGAGCGLTDAGVEHKCAVLSKAVENFGRDDDPHKIIAHFGGYEMVMAIGGMLKAAELGMVIIIDGFIMTSCILAASKIDPEVANYAIFSHCGDEAGHKRMLEKIGAKPILSLGLRLGEGTGALCAYPIIKSGVLMINEMNSFGDIEVTKYF